MMTTRLPFTNTTSLTTLTTSSNTTNATTTANSTIAATTDANANTTASVTAPSAPAMTSSTSSPITTTTFMCPDLKGGNETAPNHHRRSAFKPQAFQLSTDKRSVGTVVRAECPATGREHLTVYLQCQGSGQWNSSLPLCIDSLDVSSYRLFFAVGGGVAGLIVLALCCIYCALLREGRRNKSRSESNTSEQQQAKYVDPYHIGERLYSQNSSSDSTQSDTTYAKPTIFTTYINPSFHEDAYDRWRKQERNSAERLYDSPWTTPRGLKTQMENPEFKWSQSSLKTIGESGFQGLPRAQISTDRLSVESGDSAGQVSTTRSLDPLFLSSSVSAETLHGVKRYRRMRSREMESGTLSNQKVPARGSRGEENYGSLADGDGDSTIGLTIL